MTERVNTGELKTFIYSKDHKFSEDKKFNEGYDLAVRVGKRG